MTGRVTASLLNARAMPDISGRKLAVLSKGTVIEILGEYHGWYEIRHGTLHAFVCSEYVQIGKQQERHTGVVTARLLNVRDLPGNHGAVIGSLAAGTVVQVLSFLDGWYEIAFNGSAAFVSQKYVEMYERRDANRRAIVTAHLLNVRSGPGLNAPVVGRLAEKSQVVINAILGMWCEIPFNHRIGFVSLKYLSISDSSPDESAFPILMNLKGVEEDETGVERPARFPEEEDILEPEFKLPVTGTSVERNVASIWNRYGGLLQRLSKEKGIDMACAISVLCVESAGHGFDPSNNNRMVIRFENHLFWRFYGRHNPEIYRQHFRYDKEKAWRGHRWRRHPDETWKSFHGNQHLEWDVLTFARKFADEAALKSISMGAPQIMGFNHEAIGYYSVQEMFQAFSRGIEAQIRGLFDFMTPAMKRQLEKRDFVAFAALYNGTGQKEHYGRNIKRHYDAFRLMV